jgi:hypothetical protein
LARPAATAGDDELVDEVLRALGDLEDVRLGFRIEVSIARTEAAMPTTDTDGALRP